MAAERDLERYFSELSAYPLLDARQERECASRIEHGDELALDRLVQSNLRFVGAVVRKYWVPGCSVSRLIDEGNLGLVRAAHRFEGRHGIRFIHLALWGIQAAVLEELKDQTAVFSRRAMRRVLRVIRGSESDLPPAGKSDHAWNEEDRLGSWMTDITAGLMETVEGTLNALDEEHAEVVRWLFGLESAGHRTAGDIAVLRGCGEDDVLRQRDQALRMLRHLPPPPAGDPRVPGG